MHCTPKKTLKLVLESGNDYVVAVKSNQFKLYQHLETFDRHLDPLPEHEEQTLGRGRQENRRVKVYQASGLVETQWVGVQSILCVERWGICQGKAYMRKAYYISSVLTSASRWQSIIRSHWGIENRLHWPKDVVMGEDAYRLEEGQALVNWSAMRTIVINILQLNGFRSVKTALTKLANRVQLIFSLPT